MNEQEYPLLKNPIELNNLLRDAMRNYWFFTPPKKFRKNSVRTYDATIAVYYQTNDIKMMDYLNDCLVPIKMGFFALYGRFQMIGVIEFHVSDRIGNASKGRIHLYTQCSPWRTKNE